MKLSIVTAAYNKEQSMGPLTARLISALSILRNTEWELIYVIEGDDNVRVIAETFAAEHPQICILYEAEPGGLANAFRLGFGAVSYDPDTVATMDADLNHQPEELPPLRSALFDKQADIVVGPRKVQGSTATGTVLWKRALSDSFNRTICTLIGMPIADMTSALRKQFSRF